MKRFWKYITTDHFSYVDLVIIFIIASMFSAFLDRLA